MHTAHRHISGFKRFTVISVIAAAGFSLAACSDDGSASTDSSSVSSSSSSSSSSPSSSSSSTPSSSSTATSTSAEPTPDDRADNPQRQQPPVANEAGGGAGGAAAATGQGIGWAVGSWVGHGRTLKIQPDGTGQFIGRDGAVAKDFDATVTVNSATGDPSNGTITATVDSSEPQGTRYDDMLKPGTPITFTVKDGVATDSVIQTTVCNYDSPAYTSTHSDQSECGA